MHWLEFELYRRDIDDVWVLSANRQVLLLECILTNIVYTHTPIHTLYPQVFLFTLSVGYHHYPHIYKYQTFSFFTDSFPLSLPPSLFALFLGHLLSSALTETFQLSYIHSLAERQDAHTQTHTHTFEALFQRILFHAEWIITLSKSGHKCCGDTYTEHCLSLRYY